MLKKGLMIGVVAILTLVTFSAVMMSDDSEAAAAIEVIKDNDDKAIKGNNAYQYKGVYYDLCKINASDSDYGPSGKLIAFVTGGDGSMNSGYTESELSIPAYVPYHNEVTGEDESYEVVGIRSNAFQASKRPNVTGNYSPDESSLQALTKVTFPETLVAIGVDYQYSFNKGTTASSFSKCYNLKTIVIKGENPKLKQVSGDAFQSTAIEVLDLSQCKNLDNILSTAFSFYRGGYESQLRAVDIRNANYIQNQAFAQAINIEEIVMPRASATIEPLAFTISFYPETGTIPYNVSELPGKSFKIDNEGKLREAHIATYDANDGEAPKEYVLFRGENLPEPPVRVGYMFAGWKNSAGEFVKKMPFHDETFTAVWGVGKPDTCSLVYDGTIQTAYTDTDAYTVIGNEGKDAGEYQATFTLKDNYQWEVEGTAPCDVSWLINPATIIGDIQQDGSLTYDGTPQRADVYITLVSVADEPITITYSLAADGAYSIAVPTFTDVGVHTVYYKAEAPNHDVKTGSFTVTVSAPHNSDTEGGDQVLLLLIGGIAMIAVAILVAPFIFGRP